MKKGIHEYKKAHKTVDVTVLLFILFLIWDFVENPKYKMICLKHQNQVNLLIMKQLS